MAQVPDDTTGWHPTQDKLHYGLVDSRWHLIHPDTQASTLPGFHELHDSLGDLSHVSSGLSVTGMLVKKRVPVMTGDDTNGHPVVLKGMEHDIMNGLVMSSGYYGRNPALPLPDTDQTGGPTRATTVPVTIAAPPLKIEWGYDTQGNWGPKAVTDKPPRSVRWSEKKQASGNVGLGTKLNSSLPQPFDSEKLGETLVPYKDQLRAERDRFNPPGTTAPTDSRPPEAHYNANDVYVPPAAVRDSFDSDNRFANPGFKWDRTDWRAAPVVAEYITKMMTEMGAPVVPYTTSTIDATRQGHKEVNRRVVDAPFFRSPYQQLAVMPYIAEDSDLPRAYPVHYNVTEYKGRLAGRLKTGETLMGAPDRHDGNYVQVPMALPDGTHTMVRHGIDYELPYQNHNRHFGQDGHGVLPDEHDSADYDPTDPNDPDLIAMSRNLMANARMDALNVDRYTQLSEQSQGALDVIRAFPGAVQRIPAPRHAAMEQRARAMAKHLSPESYDHDDPDRAAAPHLYKLWKLMEGQDEIEPPVGRAPFIAPVVGEEINDNRVFWNVVKAKGWTGYRVGKVVGEEPDVQRGLMKGAGLRDTADLEAALRHLKRLAAAQVPPQPPRSQLQDEEQDQKDYLKQMEKGGWRAGIGTMVGQGDSTNRRVLGDGGFSYVPAAEKQRILGALRHVQRQRDWAAENPETVTPEAASTPNDPVAEAVVAQERNDKFLFDEQAKMKGWQGPQADAWLNQVPTQDFAKLLPRRGGGYDRDHNEAILRHLRRLKTGQQP